FLCQIADRSGCRFDPPSRPERGPRQISAGTSLCLPPGSGGLPETLPAVPPQSAPPALLQTPVPWRGQAPESVIVYDPALEFWECHARPERGDVLLHPLSEDCPHWDLADEIQNPLLSKALSMSFLPSKEEGKADFWDQASQKILALLLQRLAEEGGSTAQLLDWLSNPGQIDEMVRGTPLERMISPEAAPQREGVLASLNMIAEALGLLPPDDGRPKFSFRRWVEAGWKGQRRPWVFIASRFPERDALRPLV